MVATGWGRVYTGSGDGGACGEWRVASGDSGPFPEMPFGFVSHFASGLNKMQVVCLMF